MYIDNAEAAYLVTRIRTSKQMAMSAIGGCARNAHEELAERYQARLSSLLRNAATNLPVSTNSQAQTMSIPA